MNSVENKGIYLKAEYLSAGSGGFIWYYSTGPIEKEEYIKKEYEAAQCGTFRFLGSIKTDRHLRAIT